MHTLVRHSHSLTHYLFLLLSYTRTSSSSTWTKGFPLVIILTDANNLSSILSDDGNLPAVSSGDKTIARWAWRNLSCHWMLTYANRIPGRINFLGDWPSRMSEHYPLESLGGRQRPSKAEVPAAIRQLLSDTESKLPQEQRLSNWSAQPHFSSSNLQSTLTEAQLAAAQQLIELRAGFKPELTLWRVYNARNKRGSEAAAAAASAGNPAAVIPGHTLAPPLLQQIITAQQNAPKDEAVWLKESLPKGYELIVIEGLGPIALFRGRLIVPASCTAVKQELLRLCHDMEGHPGGTRMLYNLRVILHVHWAGMQLTVFKWVETCLPCQQEKDRPQWFSVWSGVSTPTFPPSTTPGSSTLSGQWDR